MAEFWKSAPKYWCKQCKVYIRDTAFEKSQHEASGKHQGALKRFLREIHRDNERQERDSQRAQHEVERLKRTVAGSSSAPGKEGDGGDDAASPWKRAAAAAPPPPPPKTKASLEERKRQMAQLAEMGVAVPEEFRGDLSLTGEWQTVSERVIESEDTEKPAKSGASIGVRKRKHEGHEDGEDETEKFVSKAWGSRHLQYPGARGGDDHDLDALLASTKDIKKAKTSNSDDAVPAESDKDPNVSAGQQDDTAADTATPATDQPSHIKEEEPSESAPVSKGDPDDAAPGVVFKKRKPKVIRK